MNRRQFSVLAALALGVGLTAPAFANTTYPNKPVKILVGYAAGGPTDMVARMLASKLQEKFGQPFIVENRAGGGSNIASEAAARANPDGYTLLMAAAPFTMNGFVYKDQKFHPQKNFDPISLISSSAGVLAVSPTLPFKSFDELAAHAKGNPGRLNYGSTGVAGSQHMATERLQRLAKIQLNHVPYKGASAVLSDLIAGHVQMAFMTASGAMSHMQSGAVRPLAVAAPKRLKGLPNVPTFAEIGLEGMLSDSWNGLLAPAGTPAPIVAALAAAVDEILKMPDVRSKLEDSGAEVASSSPDHFRKVIAQELVHWEREFKTVNLDLK